jgi:pyruvate dehydrogenase E2 component (dihydrolipoamide acetyltransferase)
VDNDSTTLKKSINIGIAVSVSDGLVVPVIENCQAKTLEQLSADSRQHVEAVRQGKSLSNTVASFTVSNLGMYAIDTFLPIINPPECAILAVGQAADKPVVIQGDIQVRTMMTLTLACDHRAVDGTMAAGFLESLKGWLEDPDRWEQTPQ